MNFKQRVTINRQVERRAYIAELTTAKAVLHLGASDTGLPEASIDNLIRSVASGVFSVDIEFPPHFEGEHGYYNLNTDTVKDCYGGNYIYDIVIAGEVLEHLTHPKGLADFIYSLTVLPTEILITVPNAFAPHRFSENRLIDGVFEEIVHPGHFSWYSPYTLTNFAKSTLGEDYGIKETVLIDNSNSIGIHLRRKYE
jgi:hypothetical protein